LDRPAITADRGAESEDHAADSVRYACMSRPYAPKPKEPEPMRGIGSITVEEFIKGSMPQRIRV
jgi:hypothetical protein